MAKILIFGEISFESQYILDRLPQENEVVFADSVTNIIGSKSINVGRVYEKLHHEVYFSGRVGNDSFGKLAIQTFLKNYNFNVEYVSTSEKLRTGQITVMSNRSGANTITLFSGANKELTPDDISAFSKNLIDFDFVYATTSLPLSCLYELVTTCHAGQKPLFLDIPNQQKSIVLNELATVDFIAPNRQEAELLLNIKITSVADSFKALKKLRQSCKGTLIITLDADGCVIFEKISSIPYHLPTKKVAIKDATAAGDIFRAVFVSEILNKKTIKSAAKKALEVATESVKISGVNATLENLKYN